MKILSVNKYTGILGIAFLTSCSASKFSEKLPEIYNNKTFASALEQEYMKLAQKESTLYNQSIDTHHFAIKASQAFAGDETVPEYPADWNLSAAHVAEMNEYRERLTFTLHNAGRLTIPQLAAETQVAFDCWIEEAEEGKALNETTLCKQTFLTKLQELEKVVQTRSPLFVIWFDMNSAKITDKGKHEIDLITQAAHNMPAHKLVIKGLTDGIGGRKFNLQLSHDRAEIVKQAIIANGIGSHRLVTSVGMGEAPGTRELEPNNRRVEVQLVYKP